MIICASMCVVAFCVGFGSDSLSSSGAGDTDRYAPVAFEHAMIDRVLQLIPANIIGIDAERVLFTDESGTERTRQITDLLAIVRSGNGNGVAFDDDESSASAQTSEFAGTYPNEPFIALTDGRVLTGRFRDEANTSETISWENELLGLVEAPLSDLRYIRLLHATGNAPGAGFGAGNEGGPSTSAFNSTPLTPAADEGVIGDVLYTTNGDRFVGFLETVGPSSFAFDADGQMFDIERSRVAAIRLDNLIERPDYHVCRAWLDDGSVIDVQRDRMLTEGSGLRIALAPDGEDRWIRFDSWRAIALTNGAIEPLARIEHIVVSRAPADPGNSAAWFDHVERPVVVAGQRPLGLGDLNLVGPIEIEFALPAHTERFAARAVVPRAALDWASFDFVMKADGREIQRSHFDAEVSEATLTVEIPEGTRRLGIALASSSTGPIYTMLTLERPRLLIREP